MLRCMWLIYSVSAENRKPKEAGGQKQQVSSLGHEN